MLAKPPRPRRSQDTGLQHCDSIDVLEDIPIHALTMDGSKSRRCMLTHLPVALTVASCSLHRCLSGCPAMQIIPHHRPPQTQKQLAR